MGLTVAEVKTIFSADISPLEKAHAKILSDTKRLSGAVTSEFTSGGKTAGAGLGDGLATGAGTGGKQASLRARAALLAAPWKGTGSHLGETVGTGLSGGLEPKVKTGGTRAAGLLKMGLKATAWLGVGAGIGGALGVGLTGAFGREVSSDKLTAQLGATPKQAEKYGKISAGLWKDAWGESTADVNDVIRSVVTNIGGMRGTSSKHLKAITADVLGIRDAFDEDGNAITRAADKMVRTGLAKNAKQALDIITVGFQKGANQADDLLDTYSEYGTQFRKLGIDGKTATGLISQGLKGGARDADLVADSLKEFSIRAVDGSKLTKQGFDLLGLSGKDMGEKIGKGGKSATDALQLTLDKLRGIDDPVKRNAAAVDLFGTQAEDMGKALFSLDPKGAVDALGKVGGAAKKAGDDLSGNASTKITEWKRTAQDALVGFVSDKAIPSLEKLGDSVGKKLGPEFHRLGPDVKAFGSWFRDDAGPALSKFGGEYLDGAKSALAGFRDTIRDNKPMLRSIGTVLTDVVIPALGWFTKTISGPQLGAGFKVIGKSMSLVVGQSKVVTLGWLRMGEYGVKSFRMLLEAALASFGGILTVADKTMGWIPGIGDKIHGAKLAFDGFADDTIDNLKGVEKKLHDAGVWVDDLGKKKPKVKVSTPGLAAAQAGVQGLTGDVNHVPGKKTVTVGAQTGAARAALAGITGQINNLPRNPVIHVAIQAAVHAALVAGGGPRKHADGGLITGAGGPRDDRIPAMLSNREYVIPADAVAHYGVGFFDRARAKKLAGGGLVGGSGSKATAASIAPSFSQAAQAWSIAQASLATLKNARATTDAHLADLQAQQQIRDINRDLAKMEGKKGHRHHALKGLDREIAQAQLVQAKEQAATTKAQAGFGEKGTTAHDQITSMAGVFGTGTTSAKQLLKNFQTDETTNAQWAGLLAKLKTSGLSKGLLDQFTANGPSAQALALGKSILSTGNIKELNQAQSTIGKQADQLGYFADGKKGPGTGKNGGPLVAIDKFYAGGMSPDEIAEKLYFKAQVRG